jgi:hypothetical protein
MHEDKLNWTTTPQGKWNKKAHLSYRSEEPPCDSRSLREERRQPEAKWNTNRNWNWEWFLPVVQFSSNSHTRRRNTNVQKIEKAKLKTLANWGVGIRSNLLKRFLKWIIFSLKNTCSKPFCCLSYLYMLVVAASHVVCKTLHLCF